MALNGVPLTVEAVTLDAVIQSMDELVQRYRGAQQTGPGPSQPPQGPAISTEGVNSTFLVVALDKSGRNPASFSAYYQNFIGSALNLGVRIAGQVVPANPVNVNPGDAVAFRALVAAIFEATDTAVRDVGGGTSGATIDTFIAELLTFSPHP